MPFVCDFYHGNFNDGPVPLRRILDDERIVSIILKYTEGTSYDWANSWAIPQGERVRGSRAALGGYHMLSGADGSGKAQADYFLSKYQPQPGDVIPAVDFEASGQNGRGETPLSTYKDKLKDFCARIHEAGFPVMLYGHATVKAAFDDWRDSGADYWWCPGSVLHDDVGPRGPDLWQYSPYAAPKDWPTDPAELGHRTDVSKVITALPLIEGADQMFEKWHEGWSKHELGIPIDMVTDPDERAGWRDRKLVLQSARQETQALIASHTHESAVHSHPHAHTFAGITDVTDAQ